jgi:hypothetical protein
LCTALVCIIFPISSCTNESSNDDSSRPDGVISLPLFSDVTDKAGIKSSAVHGQSGAWADVNNDDRLDLIVTNAQLRRKDARNVFLYRNDGLPFTDITERSGILNQAILKVAWGDYNNDNRLDLIVGTAMGNAPPKLYKNLGGGVFVDESTKAGVTKQGGVSHAIWVDYDRDGLLDIFQAKRGGSFLYKNQGNETFAEVSDEAGLRNSFLTRSAVWFDFDNDGFQDLFLANDGLNTLYKNDGDGSFTDITDSSGLAGDPTWRSVAACVGDYDNDGFLDLYVNNINTSRKALYRNKGDGSFADVTSASGTQDVGDGRTCSWVDFDADGRIDIFTTNHLNPSKLYRNLGNGKFEDVAPQVGLDSPIDAFAATWGDFNNDGYMDVFLTGHIGTALMKSSGNNANYLILKLRGDGSLTNTSAIGTRVELRTSSGIQIREVSGGRGCCEQDMLPLHFGLGKEKRVDILVKWTSGKQCSFNGVNVDGGKVLKLSEEACDLEEINV